MTAYPVGSAGPEGYTIVNAVYTKATASVTIPGILYEGRSIKVSFNELACNRNSWRMVFTYKQPNGNTYGLSYDSYQSDTQDHFGLYSQGGSTSAGRFAVTWPNTLTFEAIAQTGFKCYYGDRLIAGATPRTGTSYNTDFIIGGSYSSYTGIDYWEITKIEVYDSDKTLIETILPAVRDSDGVVGFIKEDGTFAAVTGTAFFK